MTAPTNKEYLGDGVYVRMTDWGDVELMAEDGISCTNYIVLEPAVYAALIGYVQRQQQERVNAANEAGR